jgi:prephenate dehydrogenase
MPQLAQRAVIIGVGLIGGSLALRWREQGAVGSVVGCGRSPERLARALELGVIDEVAPDVPAALAGADLVVLAAPVRTCLELVPEVARLAAPGALITDVCSTKAAIVERMAAELPPGGATFIGGHPMAGSERAGVEAADPYLFEQAVWALCPGPAVPPAELERLTALVTATGAHPLRLDPRRHDARVALISHLPQLAAVALAETAGEGEARDAGLLSLAGGGFRDTTRIAQSPASMWLDVLATNRGPVLAALDALADRLGEIRAAVAGDDAPALRAHFDRAGAVRQRVPARQKGLLPGYHDLVLFVPDRPGVIGALCGALGDRGINVQDIEILRLREGEGGTLRLGFAEEAQAGAALAALGELGYRVQRR